MHLGCFCGCTAIPQTDTSYQSDYFIRFSNRNMPSKPSLSLLFSSPVSGSWGSGSLDYRFFGQFPTKLERGVRVPYRPPNKGVDFDRKPTPFFNAVKPLKIKAFPDIEVCFVPLSERFRSGLFSFSGRSAAPVLQWGLLYGGRVCFVGIGFALSPQSKPLGCRIVELSFSCDSHLNLRFCGII